MDWRIGVIAIMPIAMYFLWMKFLKTLKTNRKQSNNINAIFLSIAVIFSIGFLLRLNADRQIIDLGYYLTDLSFLLSYTLIGMAALLGQAKYNS